MISIKDFVQIRYRDLKSEGFSDQKIARILGVTRNTVHRWKVRGIIAPVPKDRN